MMNKRVSCRLSISVLSLLLLCSLSFFQLQAQELSGTALLEKIIAHHDPSNQWGTLEANFKLQQVSPNKPLRKTSVYFNNNTAAFSMERASEEGIVIKGVQADTCFSTTDGKAPKYATVEDALAFCEDTKSYRDYYHYMLGLPMKLQDSGTQIGEQASKATFMGKPCWALKITYEAAVGKDTWYFYADPNTFALIGCRFYHDESKNDGEYIVFQEEVSLGQMRFPKSRAWYMNADDKYLGTDTITSIEN